MMLYPSVNELKTKADSRYTLVILTAKRARDIISGKPVLTDFNENDRAVTLAAYEVADDMITYSRQEDEDEGIYSVANVALDTDIAADEDIAIEEAESGEGDELGSEEAAAVEDEDAISDEDLGAEFDIPESDEDVVE